MTTTVLLMAAFGFSLQSSEATRPMIEEQDLPFASLSVTARDGQPVTNLIRKPPGKGPFPALIYLHGALDPWPLARLKEESLAANLSRFLAAGYVVVIPSLRRKREDPQSEFALWDGLAIIEKVRKLPEVDPKSIVGWGDSGGGSLALELAGETQLQAIVVQEPATVLFTGMYGKEHGADQKRAQELMAAPQRSYTPELQKKTREKIRRIRCPMFIAHSDVHVINKINNEIFIPELQRAGKPVEVVFYPGQPHGFSRGTGSPAAAKKFFEDANKFLRQHLAIQPKPLPERLVKQVPDSGRSRSDEPRR